MLFRFESFVPKNLKRHENAPIEYRQYLYVLTYQKTLPEVEDDFSDQGTEIEETLASVEEIEKVARDYGTNMKCSENNWESHPTTTDYRTGEETSWSLHIRKADKTSLSKEESEFFKDLIARKMSN